MPYIKRLSIVDFKNISNVSLEFSRKINCICGDNAQGKTNLLEAVHYLSMARTSGYLTDRFVYRHGTEKMGVTAEAVLENGLESRYQIISEKGEKTIRKDEKTIPKLSEHLGQLPVVMISPSDEDLVGDGAECRRKFLNAVICQVNREYLAALQQYNRLLTHRNAILKSESADPLVLGILNDQMAAQARIIFDVRKDFLESLGPLVEKFYSEISGIPGEVASLRYVTGMKDDTIATMFADSIQADMSCRYTTVGPQRDDVEFSLSGHPLRKHGSQGQRKSFLVALKMAQYSLMRSRYGFSPILLLDDLFDKLDYSRISNLLGMVLRADFGQVFITDCNKSRLQDLVEKLTGEGRFFEAENGSFTLIEN